MIFMLQRMRISVWSGASGEARQAVMQAKS
jgi:hypothetical protein